MKDSSLKNVLKFPKRKKQAQQKGLYTVSIRNPYNVFDFAIKVHKKNQRTLFLSFKEMIENKISFKNWPYISSTTFFVASWACLTTYQKKQVKNLYQTSPDLKIIIGLEKGDKNENFFKTMLS